MLADFKGASHTMPDNLQHMVGDPGDYYHDY
jgi:hypothetical protein